MTYEEAIEEMENIYQNGFNNDFDNDEIEKPLDAIRIAIEALEKQMPKKPTQKVGSIYYYCSNPECGTLYTGSDYCCNCGQRLEEIR